jgi:hypothetical protein
MRVVSTFERGTLPDEGDSIDDEINKAIAQFDIERKIRRAEDNRAPDSIAPGTNGDAESVDDIDLEDVDLDDPNLLDLETAARVSRGGTDD